MDFEKQITELFNSARQKAITNESLRFIEQQRQTSLKTKKATNRSIPGKRSHYREIGNNAYSYLQCIRTFDPNIGWIFNITKYSKTTSRHQTHSRLYCGGKFCPNFLNRIKVSFDSNKIVNEYDLIKQAYHEKGIEYNG